jgi:transcriptional regulator with XRE-family HTH domain
MTYAEVIRTQRKAKGLTLEVLAKKCGTFKGYISGIENARVAPPAAGMAVRLARVLGVDADDLLELGWATKAPKRIRARAMDCIKFSGNALLCMSVPRE